MAPGQPANLFTRLSNTLDKTGAQLLVIDSLYNVFTGDKLEERHAWEFMAMLRGLARQMDGAIVMTYHPSQSGLASGSGEFGASAGIARAGLGCSSRRLSAMAMRITASTICGNCAP